MEGLQGAGFAQRTCGLCGQGLEALDEHADEGQRQAGEQDGRGGRGDHAVDDIQGGHCRFPLC
jgi:hypothetical protein